MSVILEVSLDRSDAASVIAYVISYVVDDILGNEASKVELTLDINEATMFNTPEEASQVYDANYDTIINEFIRLTRTPYATIGNDYMDASSRLIVTKH